MMGRRRSAARALPRPRIAGLHFIEPGSGRNERLWSEERPETLPDAEGTSPAEDAAAIRAPSPAVVVERDPPRRTDAAHPRHGFRNATPPAFLVDLTLEMTGGFLRIAGEGEPREVVALAEHVPRLAQERAHLGRAQIVRLRLSQDRLARHDDRLRLLDLRLPKLNRPFDLPLLTLHSEALRAFQQVPGPGVVQEALGLPHVGADVPREFDVVRDRGDRPFDLFNPAGARVARPPARLDEALSRRREPMPIEEIGALLPGVFGEGD